MAALPGIAATMTVLHVAMLSYGSNARVARMRGEVALAGAQLKETVEARRERPGQGICRSHVLKHYWPCCSVPPPTAPMIHCRAHPRGKCELGV